jgi:hypothetical protein
MFMIITLLHCYLTVAVIAASRNAAARVGRRRSRDTMLFKCEAGLGVGASGFPDQAHIRR